MNGICYYMWPSNEFKKCVSAYDKRKDFDYETYFILYITKVYYGVFFCPCNFIRAGS